MMSRIVSLWFLFYFCVVSSSMKLGVRDNLIHFSDTFFVRLENFPLFSAICRVEKC